MQDQTMFLFPGQGSQFVGMATALADQYPQAKQILQEIDEALGQNLSTLMRDGPESELTRTENAQPALMAASLAVVRALEFETQKSLKDYGHYVAGHSLGEYSALAATNVIGIAQTAKLLKLRGQAMQRAVAEGKGAMAAIIGLEEEALSAILQQVKEDETVTIANDNGGGQIVISGNKGAVMRACELAKQEGAKRALPLSVSAPFHCPLMQAAADEMAQALGDISFQTPSLPVINNVSAMPQTAPDILKQSLIEQVCAPVRWRESILKAKQEGITQYIELGAGKVLSGLVRRIDRDGQVMNVGTPEEMASLITHLQTPS